MSIKELWPSENFAIYSYQLKTSIPELPIRKGLVIEWGDGWGEISPLPNYSEETLEEAQKELLWLQKNRLYEKAKLPSVRFGLDCAKKPFQTSPLKIPLSLLNHPRPGFSHVKIKLGSLPVHKAITLTKKLKNNFRLRLDFNQKWNLDQALEFSNQFIPEDFEYLEEPLNSFSDLKTFSEKTHFPIAIDESQSLHPYPQIPTLKAIIIKPTIRGQTTFDKTSSNQVEQVLSSAYETSLGLLLIARSYKQGTPPPGLDTFKFFQEDLLFPPLDSKNGYLLWPGNCGCPIDRSKLCKIA